MGWSSIYRLAKKRGEINYMTNLEVIHKFASQVLNTDGLELGPSVILDEITFVPIIKLETPRDERDYLTLSEALEMNACKIFDKGTEVAHIVFQNIGSMPILIEEGEIFLGQGTQDRICVATIMVPPGETMEIPVKCVHAPHHLRSGAMFNYGGKCSRIMLNELRSLKFHTAAAKVPVSSISQGAVWDKVAMETSVEASVSDRDQYTQAVAARRERAKLRSENLEFPHNTIGVVVLDPEGTIKALEIHRSPNNFTVRKDGILESLEANLSWEKTGKGAYQKAHEKVKSVFKNLSELKEGTQASAQVEVDGLVLNIGGISGEVLTSKFYSAVCPQCNKLKPRKSVCPACGFEEDATDEIAYMSLA